MSPSTSDLKAAYLQSRLEKLTQQKSEVTAKLAQAEQEKVQTYYMLNEQNLLQGGDRSTSSKDRKDLDELHSKILKMIETYRSKGKEVDELQRSMNIRCAQIQSLAEMIPSLEEAVENIEQELEEFENAETIAARQTEMLDLKRFELRKLAEHANTNDVFYNQLQSVADGNATSDIKRAIKSELFDQLTDISEEEFVALTKRILAAKKDPSMYVRIPTAKPRGEDSSDEELALSESESDSDPGSETSDAREKAGNYYDLDQPETASDYERDPDWSIGVEAAPPKSAVAYKRPRRHTTIQPADQPPKKRSRAHIPTPEANVPLNTPIPLGPWIEKLQKPCKADWLGHQLLSENGTERLIKARKDGTMV